jgi:RNA polymerase sigma-70 factor (ECF subfamily)
MIQIERDHALSALVAKLPAKLREAVVLHYAEDLDYATMAEITGCPEGTLPARAHRGLAALRKKATRLEET